MKNDRFQKNWDRAAEGWVDFVRTGKDWTRDELNNPAMFAMLDDINGKRILDLGCGEGYNSRIMAKKGAKVSGIDFSEKMIEFAVEEEKKEKLGICYHVSNASDLWMLKDHTYDVVVCFMALQDIEDYEGAVNEASRVLKKKGRFVFAIPHPCFEVRILDGKRIGGWIYGKGSKEASIANIPYWTKDKLIGNALYFTVDRYFDVCSDVVQWKMERLTKHFKTTSFHRTLTDYTDALHGSGFLISRLNEPKPTKRGLAEHPDYFGGNVRIPQSVVVEAVKC